MLIRFDPSIPEIAESERVAVALSHITVSLALASRCVCLLGAGVSTSAGIQDFRSKGEGLYTTKGNASSPASPRVPPSSSPARASSPFSTTSTRRLSTQKSRSLFTSTVYHSAASRTEHWTFLAGLHDQIEASVRDNKKKHVTRTHGLLGRLKEMGKLLRVYTQNIDGLEKTAGLEYVELPGVTPVGEKKGKETMVLDGEAEGEDEWEGDCVQLHGTLSSVRCSLCFWVGTWEPKHGRAFAKGETFDCPACENIAADRARRNKRSTTSASYLRPAILLYGEHSRADETIAAIANADLAKSPTFLLVCGTSLAIPGFKSLARAFSEEVRRNDGLCVFVNREEVGSEWDDVFDYHVLSNCDDFVQRVLSDWKSSIPDDFKRKKKRRKLVDAVPAPTLPLPALSSISPPISSLAVPSSSFPTPTFPVLRRRPAPIPTRLPHSPAPSSSSTPFPVPPSSSASLPLPPSSFFIEDSEPERELGRSVLKTAERTERAEEEEERRRRKEEQRKAKKARKEEKIAKKARKEERKRRRSEGGIRK